MTDPKLLPLPEPNGSYTNPYDGDDLENYARANVARAVEKWRESVDQAFDDIRELRHEVAAKDAEIEALKSDLHEYRDSTLEEAGHTLEVINA